MHNKFKLIQKQQFFCWLSGGLTVFYFQMSLLSGLDYYGL